MNPWARVDCYIMEDPDMVRVGHRGYVLHTGGILYAQRNETDGFVPEGVIPALVMDMPRPKQALKDLLEVGLWTEDKEQRGYWIRNYAKWQRTRAQIEEDRQSGARRQALSKDKQLREAVRERDGDHCRYCGRAVRWTDRKGAAGGTYDHVDPSGGNTIDNLVVACRACNSAKGGNTPPPAGMPLIGRESSSVSSSGPKSESKSDLVTDLLMTTPETETETNLVTPENSSNLEKTVAAVGQPPPHFEPNFGHSQPKVPEWLRVLSELQQPTPEDVRRLTEWATPHDPGVLRETAYALVEKWPEYVAKPGNQNRKPFSTFQNWVRMEEKRNPPQSTGGADGEPGNGPDPYLRAQEQYERRRAQRP